MTDEDLTDLVKNLDFDTAPDFWNQETDNEEVDEGTNLGLRRNAPRNAKINTDEPSEVRSMSHEESLEDSMDAIDFMSDKYQSGHGLEPIYKEDNVNLQASLPDFSMANVKGENTSSTLALTTTFDDDVKKYQVFEIPDDDAIFQNMCRKPIGAGVTICINTKCRIRAHEDVRRANVPQGQLYIQKNKSSVFAVPSISANSLAESIVEEWKGKSQTLETWKHRFRAATNHLADADSGFVSHEAFHREEAVHKQAKDFKTPRRNKFQFMETNNVKVYKPLFVGKTKFEEDSTQQYMEHMDSSLTNMYEELETSKKVQKFLGNLVQNSVRSAEVKLHDLKDTIGHKPAKLQDKLDTPDLWSTVGEISCQMEDTKLNQKQDIENCTLDFESRLKRYERNALTTAKTFYHKSEQRIDSLTKSMGTLLLKTQRGFAQTSANINSMRNFPGIGNIPGTNNLSANDILAITNRLSKVEQELSRAKAAEGEAIVFHNLGFQSRNESNAWLELNAPKHQFGFVVDFHTIMEHIHQQITGMDSLASLGKLYKLRLKTMSESVAMTSFEVQSPRFLTASGAHAVVDSEASYFSHIASFHKWNDPLEGFKKRWKSELNNFKSSHSEMIQAHLLPSSPLYHLALASVIESTSWVLGFINYIDETYTQYASGKFGSKKSWHITTKLATALIREIGTPRRGAMNSFEAGDAQQINQVIFYAVLRSLDKMTLVVGQNYKDAPAVSTELVKFLSMNTSVEAVDRLVEQSAELKSSYADMARKVAAASNTSTTVGNNCNKLKEEVADLKRRIVKLEQKRG